MPNLSQGRERRRWRCVPSTQRAAIKEANAVHEREKWEATDRPEVLHGPGVEFEVDTMVTRVYLVRFC